MSDISISRVYQFLSNYNKSGNWKNDADRNSNGIISEIEAYTFLDDNFFKTEGLNDKQKADIFYKFWKSMDTDTEGKVREGSKVNDKGALNEQEINNVQKNIQISERIDKFVNNNVRGKEPSVINNKAGWLNSVKDGMIEKAFDYVAKNGSSDVSDAKLREFYELTYRKATADYYFSELKNEIGKDLSEYKVSDDAALTTIVESYIKSLTGDTTTSLETIIAKVKELVEAYKDTANTNSKTSTLEPYGYNAEGALNDLQRATVGKTMFDAITKYLSANNSDYNEFKESTDAVIKEFISSYLNGKKASEFVSLNKFDINEFIKTNSYQDLIKFIQDARTAKDAATRAAQQEENRKSYGALASVIEDISADQSIMNKIYNNTNNIHTEFGIDRSGKIVFEQRETSNVYDKLKSNVLYELKQKYAAEYEKIGATNIEKLIQAAWIMTYNNFNSSQSNNTKNFIDKVMSNLKNIMSKVIENPEYVNVFTSHTAYANSSLTSGLEHYGTKTTYGQDTKWKYKGFTTISSEGFPDWDSSIDASEYKKTMNNLLAKIKNAEPYKSLNNSDLIEKIFREAQEAALRTCCGNIKDCPYGTTNSVDAGIAAIKTSPTAQANVDWKGTSREDDDFVISPKALVEMTLYYFDKLLYQQLLS